MLICCHKPLYPLKVVLRRKQSRVYTCKLGFFVILQNPLRRRALIEQKVVEFLQIELFRLCCRLLAADNQHTAAYRRVVVKYRLTEQILAHAAHRHIHRAVNQLGRSAERHALSGKNRLAAAQLQLAVGQGYLPCLRVKVRLDFKCRVEHIERRKQSAVYIFGVDFALFAVGVQK